MDLRQIYRCFIQLFLAAIKLAHLKEEVDQVWVLLQFGTDYTKELNLLVFCGSRQNLATQTDQFLREKFTSNMKPSVT